MSMKPRAFNKTARNSFFFKVKDPIVEGRIYKWSPITNTVSWRDDDNTIQQTSYRRWTVNNFLFTRDWIIEEGVKCL